MYMYMFKALVWVPWLRNVLASGGGVGDGCICLTNAVTGQRISTVDTNTQVRAIIFTEMYITRQSEIQEQVLSLIVISFCSRSAAWQWDAAGGS